MSRSSHRLSGGALEGALDRSGQIGCPLALDLRLQTLAHSLDALH